MLRAVLVGLLSLSAVACKSGSDSPKSQPGVAAGKVIEVSGSVTVRHGGVARPLASGDSVEGDDVVETGSDGNVIVELAHNLARWELGPNKTSKVRESVAWGLAKKSGEVGSVQQDTAAAGRPAERSAADTSVSATIETTAAPAAAPTAPGAPPAAEPAAAVAPPPPSAVKQSPRAEAPPKVQRARKTAADDALDNASGGGAAPNALDAESAGEGRVMTRGGNAKGAGAAVPAPPPPAAPAPVPPAAAPAPISPNTAARDLVIKHQASIKACLTKDAQAVSLRIVVGADGKATVIVKGKAELPDGVKQCVTSAVEKISFARTSATVTIDVAR